MVSPGTPPFGRYSTVPPFAFFAWLAHGLPELAERILSSLSADKRSPEGLGLERIRGASYALAVPAKQKRVVYSVSRLLLTDYHLQEAIQAVKNPQLT
jgi:hypothetical protein